MESVGAELWHLERDCGVRSVAKSILVIVRIQLKSLVRRCACGGHELSAVVQAFVGLRAWIVDELL